jgi:type II secretion system protein G
MRQRIHDLRSRKSDAGFTLIELLIVIVVLGILAGIVVFGVGAFRDQAEASVCEADVKTVQVAVDAYNASNGNFPAAVADLVSAGLIKAAPATTITITNGVAAATGGC